MPTGSSGCASGRSSVGAIHRLLREPQLGGRRRGRRCCGCTPCRAAIRSTRSSSRGRSAPTARCATRLSRCPFPSGWRSSSPPGSHGFTAPTREALVLASADARLTPAQLAGAGIEHGALDPALAEHVIELRRRHGPLHAPAARLGALPGARRPSERQRVHGRLAEIAEDPLARARHLALSTDRPDAELAALLELAAARGRAGRTDRRRRARRARAAPDAAGRPRRPRPPRGSDGARAPRCRRRRARAGARGRARRARPRRVSSAPRRSAPRRGREDMTARSAPLLKQALVEPGRTAALQASIHQRLEPGRPLPGRARGGRGHAPAAVELAEPLGDDALCARSARRARPDPLQRRQARGARARRAGVRAGPWSRRVAGRRGGCVPVLAHVLVWSA